MESAGRRALFGAAIWLIASALLVLVRGLRWDEHYELAQVWLGNVAYPNDHPLAIWLRELPNLQILTSAAIVRMFPGPDAICAFRNWLWLVSLTVPVCLIASTLARNIYAGHAGALFALLGIHLSFDAHYQMFAWPGYYSNGHIGGGFALFILWALLENRLKLALFTIAFMPAIHITQAVPVGIAGAMVGLRMLGEPQIRAVMLRAAPFALPGLIVSTVLFAMANEVPQPGPSSPYYSVADGDAILKGFLRNDPHRAMPGTVIPITNANLILGLAFVLVAFRAGKDKDRIWRRLKLYLFVILSIVWGTMLLHMLLGENIPAAMLRWMPYRFTNHAAVLMTAILPAILMGTGASPWVSALAVSALIFEAFKPLIGSAIGNSLYSRYFEDGALMLFFLSGASAVSLLSSKRLEQAVMAIGIATIACVHQFGAAMLALGAVTGLSLARFRSPERLKPPIISGAFALAGLAIIVGQFFARAPLYRTDFDRAVVVHFESADSRDAMILARPDQRTLQARLDQPVFMDEALATGIPYVPHLAPSIEKMSEDLYGIDYGPPTLRAKPSWTELWRNRSTEDWRAAASPYGIAHVISPNTVPLNLPLLVQGESEALYAIP